jgi:glucose/arabinose dehydrogenase
MRRAGSPTDDTGRVGGISFLPIIAACFVVLTASCSDDFLVNPEPGDEPGVLAVGLWVPAGIAVISEDEFLFGDRSGVLFHYVNGGLTKIAGMPESRTRDHYWGGLLDVSLHPEFSENRLVYIAYVDANEGLAVAHFVLRDGRASDIDVVFRSREFSIGSRIVWEDSRHFFLSFGVGGSPYPQPGPQDLGSDVGKIHRLDADGRVPTDNPVLPGTSHPSSIWSYGHRNPQGLYFDPVAQTLYATEHGPLGGDELNVIKAGGNYGWPLFSYGLNYDNTPVSRMPEPDARASTILPMKFWGPDFRVAPSGLLMHDGAFLFGALYSSDLLRYDPATGETDVLLRNVGRVRDVVKLPSGALLISVGGGLNTRPGGAGGSDGRILRVLSSGVIG